MRRRTARQADLLARLVELLAAEGFAKFTLDDLAARLRCSKTTLYALAPSKPELVVAATREFFRAATAAVEDGIAVASATAQGVVVYVRGVGVALTPLSRAFMDDLARLPPAGRVSEL